MNREEILQVLRQCPLLSDLGSGSLDPMVDLLDVMQGGPGDRLHEEGDPAESLYIIAAGRCAALCRDMGGHEQTVRTLGPGDTFGELSLLLRGQRLLTVQALTEVTLLELNAQSFRILKQQRPELCLVLIMAIVRRLGRVLDDSREVYKRIMLRYQAGLDGH
jgi:CRP-like cAMP-binding protein